MIAIGWLDFLAYMTTRMINGKGTVKRYLGNLSSRTMTELGCDSEVRY